MRKLLHPDSTPGLACLRHDYPVPGTRGYRVYKVPLRGSEQLFAGGRPTCDAPDSRQRDSLLSRVGDQAAPVRRWRVTGVGSRHLMVRYGGRGGGD